MKWWNWKENVVTFEIIGRSNRLFFRVRIYSRNFNEILYEYSSTVNRREENRVIDELINEDVTGERISKFRHWRNWQNVSSFISIILRIKRFIIFGGTGSVKSVTRYNSRWIFEKWIYVFRQKLFNVSETTRGTNESGKKKKKRMTGTCFRTGFQNDIDQI